jgi:uncharacterized membrane protein YfcA
MSVVTVLFLLAAGLIAGFINTLAGGGSLLTLPALIFAGLPSPVANATNRVAIFLQSIVGTVQFHRKGQLDIRETLWLALPALAGSVLGALLAVDIDREVFDKLLGALLIVILITLFIKPSMWIEQKKRDLPLWLRIPMFFAIGVYGGFIQAGVGFLLILALAGAIGHELVKSNALKVAIVLLFSGMSLLIFSLSGKVVWTYGLILSVGNMAGAFIGVRFAVKRGAKQVRWVVVGAVLISALKLFGIIRL